MIWWVDVAPDGVVRRWASTQIEGWEKVASDVPPADSYVHLGQVLPLPPRPGAWAVWQDGTWADPRPAEARTAALVAELTASIEAHVDAVARQRQYSDAISAASYVASTNAHWAAEAAAFVAWRDALWVWALAEITAFQSGEPPPDSIAGFVASAPPMIWPVAH